MLGQKFGNWTVIEDLGKVVFNSKGHKIHKVLVQCECGHIQSNRVYDITRKDGKASTRCKACQAQKQKTHGKHSHVLYPVWNSLISRCYNKNDKGYVNYGQRGVTVCPKWHTFDGFLGDMLGLYKTGLVIDRKDNNKGYSLSNCRWVTVAENNQNRRSTKLNPELVRRIRDEYQGGNKTTYFHRWADELNVHKATVASVFYRQSWKNI